MPRRIPILEKPPRPDVTTLKELGDSIRAQRTQLGLRIDDAADLCGVPASLLSALENGRRPVGIDKVLRVCKGLGLAVLIVHP